jgi:hypothetical protein
VWPSGSSTNAAFFVAQFSAGYTTNMIGFDLRQGQVIKELALPMKKDRRLWAGGPL